MAGLTTSFVIEGKVIIPWWVKPYFLVAAFLDAFELMPIDWDICHEFALRRTRFYIRVGGGHWQRYYPA